MHEKIGIAWNCHPFSSLNGQHSISRSFHIFNADSASPAAHAPPLAAASGGATTSAAATGAASGERGGAEAQRDAAGGAEAEAGAEGEVEESVAWERS